MGETKIDLEKQLPKFAETIDDINNISLKEQGDRLEVIWKLEKFSSWMINIVAQ